MLSNWIPTSMEKHYPVVDFLVLCELLVLFHYYCQNMDVKDFHD